MQTLLQLFAIIALIGFVAVMSLLIWASVHLSKDRWTCLYCGREFRSSEGDEAPECPWCGGAQEICGKSRWFEEPTISEQSPCASASTHKLEQLRGTQEHILQAAAPDSLN